MVNKLLHFRKFAFGLLLFFIGLYNANAQTVAFSSTEPPSRSWQESQKYQLLDVLKDLEKRFGVIFDYNRNVLQNREIVMSKDELQQGNLEKLLKELLAPVGLTFEKNNPHSYIIYPKKDTPAALSSSSAGLSHGLSTDSIIRLIAQSAALSTQLLAITVTGKVTDEEGQPLPGVSVLLKGTTTGTATDNTGSYTINVPDGQENGILVFSFIGYTPKEVAINNRTVLDVLLNPDVKALSEVVVVGYGTQKKSDLTGSVGTVKAEQLQERPVPSLNQALQGRISGVNVSSNSGRPGGQTNIRIRGFSSINSSNNPLYVIDGVILPVGTQTQGSNAIDYINPSDIASVEVLKDASATAIYGARGANGVILITTKRGSSTGGKISYDAQFSVPTIGPHRVEMLNAREFLATEDLAYKNAETYDPAGWAAGKYTDPKLKRTDPRLFDSNGNPLYDTDWLKESTQNKLSQNHQLAFTGGNNENTYGVFLGWRDDQGLLLNSYLKRYSGRFVFDSQIKKWLKVGGALSYNLQNENIVDVGTGGLNSVRMITEAIPILPIKFPDGSWAGNYHYPGMEGGENPVNLMNNRTFKVNTQTTLGNVYANLSLAKGLELRSIIGANVVTRKNNEYMGRSLNSIAADQKGISIIEDNRETYWSFENYLTYNTRIAQIHSLTAMLGASWQETQIFNDRVRGEGFLTDYFQSNNIGSATSIIQTGNPPETRSSLASFAFNSYFGRVNYSLKDKYLLTLTGRVDGSSKFGENNKYALFPSAALAWRVSDEPFIKNSVPFISNLKLRTSYGLTGNSEIATYSALGLLRSTYFYILNNARASGIGLERLANNDLQWEKTAQTDAGIELGLFNNRIAIEADFYYRKTTDMLLSAPLPRSSGYDNITRNIGSMENKGIELSLNTVNVEAGGFTWSTTFNVSINRNKVLSLATPADIFSGNPSFLGNTGIIRVGESVGSFYGLVRLGTWGVNEADEAAKYTSYRSSQPILPGDIKYKDMNGDYVINDADRVIIGNNNPDAYGTFLNTFKYKNFDLTVDLQYSYGNDVLNMTKHSAEDRTGIANSYKSVLNAWTPQNQNTPIAAIRDTRAGYVTNIDSRWVEDGSFLRGRNLLLGYTFPTSLAERMYLSRLRVYGSVQNFFLRTKFSGNDPEVTSVGYGAGNFFSQGQTFFDYPKPTVFMLGISVGL
jgi:TonB-linked SusC/RagA family outer membrane protein